jgi:prevent-host-death family protein
MEMSIREAKAKFSEAVAAAARGESTVITKYGQPVAQISPPQPVKKGGFDFERATAVRKQLGLDTRKFDIPDGFFDESFSREVLGLDPE